MLLRCWFWIINIILLLPVVAADRLLPKPIIGIICTIVGIALFFLCCYPIYRRRQRQRYISTQQPWTAHEYQPNGVNVIHQTGIPGQPAYASPVQYPNQSYIPSTYPIVTATHQQTPTYPPYQSAQTQPSYPPYPPPMGFTAPQTSTTPYPSAPPPLDSSTNAANVQPPPYSALFPEKTT